VLTEQNGGVKNRRKRESRAAPKKDWGSFGKKKRKVEKKKGLFGWLAPHSRVPIRKDSEGKSYFVWGRALNKSSYASHDKTGDTK